MKSSQMQPADIKRLKQAMDWHLAGKPEESEHVYLALHAAYPQDATVLHLLGVIAMQKGNITDALSYFRQAVTFRPDFTEAHYEHGHMSMQHGKYDEAHASLNKALQLTPGYANAGFLKGTLFLLQGNYREGWPLYEYRWQVGDNKSFYSDKPLWLGKESLQGKTLLLHAEQGAGDAIQMCRYIPLFQSKGIKVILGLHASLAGLKPLVQRSLDIPQVIRSGESVPPYDYHCPLFSLPLALGTCEENIPADIPYLFAEPQKLRFWQEKLGPKTRPRIGLVWSGAQKHKNDRNRSLALQQILPLLNDTYEFHSLHKEYRAADKEALAQTPIVSHAEQIHDFDDTAALISAMDLVITVDTSVAHLAGALGKPVWILLPFVPDFRWLLNRADSPWYPTARLFRQPVTGDWHAVLSNVAQALQKVLPTDSHDALVKAVTVHRAGDLAQADMFYRQILASHPEHIEALTLMGTLASQRGDYQEGIVWMDKAIHHNPAHAEAWFNRALSYQMLGAYEKALHDYDKATRLDATYTEAFWHKSLILLTLGHYEEGWKLYESRWQRGRADAARHFTAPLWLGESLPGDATLLVHVEQGYGDTLQFCRYLPLMARRCRVVFECYDSLAELMQYNFPQITVVKMASDYPGVKGLPRHDFHTPLLSLPMICGTTLATIPTGTYLKAQPDDVARWQPILDKATGSGTQRIGICWAGGQRPDRPDALAVDARRSLAFAQIKPLLDVENTAFISLQLGAPSAQIDDTRVIDITSQIQSWSDTAAIIDQLDVVISADTSVAHLAAAMGKPTYLLNRWDACWRWLVDRDDSPWYPTLTQFRQTTPGDWEGVIKRVKAAIIGKVTSAFVIG